MQQVSQTIFVAIVMGEKAVIHVVQVCALIDKGVAFNLGNSPGSCLAAHQVVLDSIGTRNVKQQQPSWLEHTPDLSERPDDPLPKLVVNGRNRQCSIECLIRPSEFTHLAKLSLKADLTSGTRLLGLSNATWGYVNARHPEPAFTQVDRVPPNPAT